MELGLRLWRVTILVRVRVRVTEGLTFEFGFHKPPIIGDGSFEKLRDAFVIVVGLGGVGAGPGYEYS